jgi:hypothetical protein
MDGNFLQLNSVIWLTVSSVLQAIWGFLMVVITIIAILWAKRQVDESKKARVLSAYLTFEARLRDEKEREARKFIYEHNFEHPSAIDPDHQKILEGVCTTFDVLGVLVREELMYRPLVFKPFYDVIIKCWQKAYDFIEFERSPTRKAQTYMQDFQYLYEQAEAFRVEHNFPPVTVHKPYAGKASIVPSPQKLSANKKGVQDHHLKQR